MTRRRLMLLGATAIAAAVLLVGWHRTQQEVQGCAGSASTVGQSQDMLSPERVLEMAKKSQDMLSPHRVLERAKSGVLALKRRLEASNTKIAFTRKTTGA